MSRLSSPLGSWAARSDSPDPAAARRIAQSAYQRTGFVAIDPTWLELPDDRERLRDLADKVHGARSERGA